MGQRRIKIQVIQTIFFVAKISKKRLKPGENVLNIQLGYNLINSAKNK